MAVTIRLGARLRAARKAAGFKTSKVFLKKHKVAASTYSQHESGTRTPDDEMLRFYSEAFGVNFNWLKTGKGQPYQKISSAEKNIMSEELMNLKQHRNAFNIDQEILAQILEKLLQNLDITNIKVIAKKAAKIYAKLTNTVI